MHSSAVSLYSGSRLKNSWRTSAVGSEPLMTSITEVLLMTQNTSTATTRTRHQTTLCAVPAGSVGSTVRCRPRKGSPGRGQRQPDLGGGVHTLVDHGLPDAPLDERVVDQREDQHVDRR